MPQLMPLLVTPKIEGLPTACQVQSAVVLQKNKSHTEGLHVFCVEDQQILLLPLIFYAISQKTISINLSGYWVCVQDIISEVSCTTKHGRLFFCQLVTVQT
jgi:hypothetical protein